MWGVLPLDVQLECQELVNNSAKAVCKFSYRHGKVRCKLVVPIEIGENDNQIARRIMLAKRELGLLPEDLEDAVSAVIQRIHKP